MSFLLLRGLVRARGLAGEASLAAATAIRFASGAAAGGANESDAATRSASGTSRAGAPPAAGGRPAAAAAAAGGDAALGDMFDAAGGDAALGDMFDAAAAGQVPRVHQLIGDARTGVADDTTQLLHGDVSIEWIWHQHTNEVDWFRYSIAGPDVLPHMHMDSRLSDHSKNLLYLLRCKDPERWTIEALATKFRIRRQRVLAILALKEIESQAMERGELMKGPYSPFAFTVSMDDFLLDGAGEPLDLGDAVHMTPEAAAAAQQQQQRQQQQQQAGSKGRAAADDPLGSLSDFLEPGSADGGGGAGGAVPSDTLTQLQLAASGGSHDLGLVMPRLAVAAQRVHLNLAQLLRRCSYSPDELRRQLLERLDAAEAAWAEHAAGSPLEAALVAAARELEAAAGPEAPQQAAAAAAMDGEGSGAAEEGGGDDGAAAAAAAAAALPRCLDFAWQRQQVAAVVAALAPLMDRTGLEEEREAARLGAHMRRELFLLASAQPIAPAAEQQQQQQDEEGKQEQQQQQDASGGEAAAPQDDPAARLGALVASAPPAALAAAFNRLDLASRRALVAAVPAARAALNVRGVDLRAALEEEAPYSPTSAAVSAIGAAASGGLQQLPSWPGAVPALEDVYRFRDIPRAAVDAAVAALRPLEDAAGALDRLLGAAAGEGPARGAGEASSADVESLRQAAAAYSTLVWAYDKILTDQEAEQAEDDDGDGDAPPPPANAQRRMMRILRELDPNALEKLLFWESFQRESEENPERAAKLRRKIQRIINKMNARLAEGEGGGGGEAAGPPSSPAAREPPEYPDLPQLAPPADRAQRIAVDGVAAFIDAEVVGRKFHRGSGDRHFVRVDSAPKFEGYTLEEFDKVREGELSALSRKVAEAEDDLMWAEFKEKVYHNLGLAGTGLWEMHGHAKPQRPEEGWSWVVHDTSKHWRSKKERARRRAAGADAAPPSSPGRGGPVPYVAQPDGALRPLNEEEAYLQQRTTPKPRRRWYFNNRRLGSG